MVAGGVPSDYFVSTQLQLWLFCCWGCGCFWAVSIAKFEENSRLLTLTLVTFEVKVALGLESTFTDG